VAVLGATATGKSALGIAIAKRHNGEIINCDSTAVYQGFNIGTDKIPLTDRQGIPHHLIDIVGPAGEYSAADYGRDASRAIDGIHDRGRLPVIVGGTGFYYRAVTRGLFDGPPKDVALRQRLERIAARRGVEFLWRMVRRLDAPSSARILPRDRKRLIRALEVFFRTGIPLTAHFGSTRSPLGDGVQVRALALRIDRTLLGERLTRRVDAQFAAGLLEEVAALLADGVPDTARPLGGLVYRQVMDYRRGVRTLAATRDLIVQENRRYARRQLIWFRKEPNLSWFDGPGDAPDVQANVLEWLADLEPVINGGSAAHG